MKCKKCGEECWATPPNSPNSPSVGGTFAPDERQEVLEAADRMEARFANVVEKELEARDLPEALRDLARSLMAMADDLDAQPLSGSDR